MFGASSKATIDTRETTSAQNMESLRAKYKKQLSELDRDAEEASNNFHQLESTTREIDHECDLMSFFDGKFNNAKSGNADADEKWPEEARLFFGVPQIRGSSNNRGTQLTNPNGLQQPSGGSVWVRSDLQVNPYKIGTQKDPGNPTVTQSGLSVGGIQFSLKSPGDWDWTFAISVTPPPERITAGQSLVMTIKGSAGGSLQRGNVGVETHYGFEGLTSDIKPSVYVGNPSSGAPVKEATLKVNLSPRRDAGEVIVGCNLPASIKCWRLCSTIANHCSFRWLRTKGIKRNSSRNERGRLL